MNYKLSMSPSYGSLPNRTIYTNPKEPVNYNFSRYPNRTRYKRRSVLSTLISKFENYKFSLKSKLAHLKGHKYVRSSKSENYSHLYRCPNYGHNRNPYLVNRQQNYQQVSSNHNYVKRNYETFRSCRSDDECSNIYRNEGYYSQIYQPRPSQKYEESTRCKKTSSEFETHFLVVEVVYEGVSLTKNEKSYVQNKMAELVEKVLRNKSKIARNEELASSSKQDFQRTPPQPLPRKNMNKTVKNMKMKKIISERPEYSNEVYQDDVTSNAENRVQSQVDRHLTEPNDHKGGVERHFKKKDMKHEVWWMPDNWARQRSIGIYSKQPSCEENMKQAGRRNNKEQIRTSNFVCL